MEVRLLNPKKMNYKIVTLVVFVLMLLLFLPFVFMDVVTDAFWGWAVLGVGIPVLVIVQVLSVLKAEAPEPIEFKEGTYENY